MSWGCDGSCLEGQLPLDARGDEGEAYVGRSHGRSGDEGCLEAQSLGKTEQKAGLELRGCPSPRALDSCGSDGIVYSATGTGQVWAEGTSHLG